MKQNNMQKVESTGDAPPCSRVGHTATILLDLKTTVVFGGKDQNNIPG